MILAIHNKDLLLDSKINMYQSSIYYDWQARVGTTIYSISLLDVMVHLDN